MLGVNELKLFASIRIKKFRDEKGIFLVEGMKQVEEGILSRRKCELIVFRTEDGDNFDEVLALARHKGIRCEAVKNREFEKLADTVHAQGILGYFRMPEKEILDRTSTPLIYLDRINDPGNMGTIIRTADWFGFRQILLSPGCVDVYNPKVVRAAMGSNFRMAFHEGVTELDLKGICESGYSIVTTELDGKNLEDFKPMGKIIIVLSNESHGVLPGLASIADVRIKIPGEKGAESLNVAVAAGIIFHKLFETGSKK
ncbi:MAG: RNA methyltransferase [Ignavibacteriaceae bacterium]|nr:RNA methyltransferase [Ignavibacteriaceae bacterium]